LSIAGLGIVRAFKDKFIHEGDHVVVTSGAIEGLAGGTSMMRVCKIESGNVSFLLK